LFKSLFQHFSADFQQKIIFEHEIEIFAIKSQLPFEQCIIDKVLVINTEYSKFQ